jgi:hypothetical protein
MFGSSLPPVVCRMAHDVMSYLYYLCLFAHSGVQHILCCVVLRLMYPILTVSLDGVFSIAPLVFSNVDF